MKISSKGRYAVRILAYISNNKKEYVSLSEISEKENITIKYLEQVISLLVKSKLVLSLRGSNGGYKLNKKPSEISIAEILEATGDTPKLAPCQMSDKQCVNKNSCSSIGYWDKLSKLIYDYLKSVTLQNLIDKTY